MAATGHSSKHTKLTARLIRPSNSCATCRLKLYSIRLPWQSRIVISYSLDPECDKTHRRRDHSRLLCHRHYKPILPLTWWCMWGVSLWMTSRRSLGCNNCIITYCKDPWCLSVLLSLHWPNLKVNKQNNPHHHSISPPRYRPRFIPIPQLTCLIR